LLVDGVIVTIAVIGVTKLPPLAWESVAPTKAPVWLIDSCAVAGALLPLLYFSAFWAMTGQTLGDMVTGIVVEHRDGRRLSFPHALLRAVVGLLLAPIWLVGMLAVLWDRHRRAWHDRLLRSDVRYASASTEPDVA